MYSMLMFVDTGGEKSSPLQYTTDRCMELPCIHTHMVAATVYSLIYKFVKRPMYDCTNSLTSNYIKLITRCFGIQTVLVSDRYLHALCKESRNMIIIMTIETVGSDFSCAKHVDDIHKY